MSAMDTRNYVLAFLVPVIRRIGLTQTQVAEASGVPVAHLEAALRGTRALTPQEGEAIAEALHLNQQDRQDWRNCVLHAMANDRTAVARDAATGMLTLGANVLADKLFDRLPAQYHNVVRGALREVGEAEATIGLRPSTI